MSKVNEFGDKLSDQLSSPLPPVEKWDPPFLGDIDIFIAVNGDWFHEEVKFTRPTLAKFFSKIIKKEADEYYLVTPVEKWRIQVEDVPFLVRQVNFEADLIHFETSTGDRIDLAIDNPIIMRKKNGCGDVRPYIRVRNNLEALIHRNIFYQLANQAVLHNGKHGVWSAGVFFPLE